MVDFLKVPVWIRRNEALRPLASRSISHVDDGLVKVNGSNNVLSPDRIQAVCHFLDLLALGLEVGGYGVVARARQYSTQVDELLSVDVLVTRTPENLGLLADAEQKHVVMLLFDGSDCLEQRYDVVPFDVVVRPLLKDLKQGVSMMTAEMLGP